MINVSRVLIHNAKRELAYLIIALRLAVLFAYFQRLPCVSHFKARILSNRQHFQKIPNLVTFFRGKINS